MSLLTIWFIYPIIEALIQAYLIEKKNWKPVYFQLFIIRGIASIVHGVIMDVEPYPWWDYPLLILFQATSFWIIFDLLLNTLRGKQWYYRGKTSGWLDRVLPIYVYWINKATALITFVYILITYE
jgi:hypothetical protein